MILDFMEAVSLPPSQFIVLDQVCLELSILDLLLLILPSQGAGRGGGRVTSTLCSCRQHLGLYLSSDVYGDSLVVSPSPFVAELVVSPMPWPAELTVSPTVPATL